MTELPATIDKRIATLQELKRRIESEGLNKTQPGKIITISREFGCDAYPLAYALKERLNGLTQENWTIFTEDAIDHTPSDSVMTANLAENFGEQSKHLEAIIASLVPKWYTEADYYREVVKTIVAIAHRGNAILVGRGASTITRGMKNCFHFRLIGSTEFRARRHAERNNMAFDKAEKIVVEKEQLRHDFLKRFLGERFNLNSFHLVFNNEKVPTELMVESIICFVYEMN
jgi:cytidylate kinase